MSSNNVHGSQVTEKDGSCNRALRGGRKSGYTGYEIERQNCYYTIDTVQVTVTREFTHRLFSLIPRPSHHPVFDFWILSKTGHGAIKNYIDGGKAWGMRLVQVTLTYFFICI